MEYRGRVEAPRLTGIEIFLITFYELKMFPCQETIDKNVATIIDVKSGFSVF